MLIMDRKVLFIFLSFSFVISSTIEINTREALMLSKYINENRIDDARNMSAVSEDFNLQSYSGFLTVNKKFNSNLFFWYFPVADRDLNKTPWIIWLQGGPGATSLFGVFKEVGPLKIENGIMKRRETTWCKNYSMVFIDNPVGAGFSFTDNDDGYPEENEAYSSDLYNAVKQLVTLYPELGKAPLYIAGESYAGRYVPGLAMKILEAKAKSENYVNLQGLIMGNPILDRDSNTDFTRVFYNWGLIDAQGARAAKPLQEQYDRSVQNGDPEKAFDLRNELLDKLQYISYKDSTYNVLKNYNGLTDFVPHITSGAFRNLIHVGDKEFNFSSLPVHLHMRKDTLALMSPKIEHILEQCRILIYCGQLDLTTPCVPNAEARRRKWRWSGRDEFLGAPRLPIWLNQSLTGYVKSGGGLTEVLLLGAGHLVPMDKPQEIRELVSNFIENVTMPTPSDYSKSVVPDYEAYGPVTPSSTFKIGFIASSILNIALLAAIIGLIVLLIRYRGRYYMSLPISENMLVLE